MTISLRPYQQQLLDGIRAELRAGRRAVLGVAPTGAGKTVCFAYMAAGTACKDRRMLILVHRRELIRQASAKLGEFDVPHGIIAPGFSISREPVQVASVQTLARRLSHLPEQFLRFDLIVVDEAHHAISPLWAKTLAALPGAPRIVGKTATPLRLDGQGLGRAAGGIFDAMVVGPSIGDLTEQGFLVPTTVYAPPSDLDLRGIATRAGDFAKEQIVAAVEKSKITGSAVAHYRDLCDGVPAIAFCISVRHAQHVAAEFAEAGYRAVALDGRTRASDRDAALAGLASGSVQVVTSCDLISEGLDVPGVGAVIQLRPTQSLCLHVQQIGRGLRPSPGKDRLIVLDHVNNVARHGLPDAPREWDLLGAERKKRGTVAVMPVRQCPSCFACHAPAPRCPACGHVYQASLDLPSEADGRLQEVVNPYAWARGCDLHLAQGEEFRLLLERADTAEKLEQIREARGYKPGWVWHQLQQRQQRQEGEAA